MCGFSVAVDFIAHILSSCWFLPRRFIFDGSSVASLVVEKKRDMKLCCGVCVVGIEQCVCFIYDLQTMLKF